MPCTSRGGVSSITAVTAVAVLFPVLWASGCARNATPEPPALQVSATSLPSGTQGTAYSATLSASGGATPYSWSISSGTLPTGLTLSGGGQISGTPTASGTFSFTVKVTDSSAPVESATANLSMVVAAGAQALEVTTSSLATGQVNSAYSASLAATGGTTPYSWSITSGTLPAGLVLIGGGQISGTPSVSGTFPITVQVRDASTPAQTATATLSLTINVSAGSNCPNGQPCGATAAFCQSYTPPSTVGATAITSLPYIIKSPGNYYLPSSLSVPTGGLVGIAIEASNVDVNLNGQTLTYGAGGSSATNAVGQYGILACDTGNLGVENLASVYGSNGYCSTSDQSNITVENGTITQSAAASGYDNFVNCPGASVGGSYSPNPCAPGGNNGDSYAATFSHNIAIFFGQKTTIQHVTFNFQQVSSDGVIDDWEQTGGDVIQCNTFNNGVMHVDDRSQIEGTAIWGGNNSGATTGDTIQYNTLVGGPQGGILSTTTGSTINNNDISIGAGPSGQVEYTNDFAIYAWGRQGVTVSNNYIHNQEGRGIGSYWNTGQTGLTIENNTLSTAEYANNYEYNTSSGGHPGCVMVGAGGIEFEGGTVVTLSGMNVSVDAGPCQAEALMDFAWGTPTTSSNSSYSAHAIGGFTGGAGSFEYEAAALGLSYGEGSGTTAGTFASTNDTFTGDSSVVYVDWQGLPAEVTLISPTLVKGTNPIHFNTFRFQNGGGNVCSGCLHVRDATFQNGASPADADMSVPAQDGKTAEYFIDWTYTLTVTNGISPLSGASVTIQDALGNTAFSGTTNTSGQISAVLTQLRMYSNTSGAAQENRSPFAVSVSAASCTTLSYTLALTATTTDNRTVSCP